MMWAIFRRASVAGGAAAHRVDDQQRRAFALAHPAVDVGGGEQLFDAGGAELLAHRLDELSVLVGPIVDACREVASASGGLGRLLGLGTGVSSEEASILDAMTTTIRA